MLAHQLGPGPLVGGATPSGHEKPQQQGMRLDAIDGTPVLDIKPYMREFGPRGEVRQPAWSHELMASSWS